MVCHNMYYFPSSFFCCTILLLSCCSLTGTQTQSVESASVKARVFDEKCVSSDMNLQRSQLQLKVKRILPGLNRKYPANSCVDINQGLQSGHYWLNVTNEPQLVYCSLNENRCCNESDGKWMRIAYLNMSDPSAQCPDGWREVQSPIRTCRRQNSTDITGINSVNYTSYGIPYSRVCGRIIAYQFGTPEGFLGHINQNQRTLDDAYVDGISITFGHPRNHIWTFAATRNGQDYCPCITSGNAAPLFVNRDHFCEVGIRNSDGTIITNNPLWDGQGCASSSACCEFNNPPWFCKQLNQTTTEDIEIRIMDNAVGRFSLEDEDTPVQFFEIYIQ